MRFRCLQMRVETTDGPYGATLTFPDGLVVFWADNSMGKSTCVRAILVALGLEAMLTTNQSDLPLPPSITYRLDSDSGQHAGFGRRAGHTPFRSSQLHKPPVLLVRDHRPPFKTLSYRLQSESAAIVP